MCRHMIIIIYYIIISIIISGSIRIRVIIIVIMSFTLLVTVQARKSPTAILHQKIIKEYKRIMLVTRREIEKLVQACVEI